MWQLHIHRRPCFPYIDLLLTDCLIIIADVITACQHGCMTAMYCTDLPQYRGCITSEMAGGRATQPTGGRAKWQAKRRVNGGWNGRRRMSDTAGGWNGRREHERHGRRVNRPAGGWATRRAGGMAGEREGETAGGRGGSQFTHTHLLLIYVMPTCPFSHKILTFTI